ncbi:ATP-binding protein [Streptomyces sp. SID3343]|uniref:ATP-binding protein n=1 Tax=Streptomyces sp. SID3343 TaxID=2690260 RepID=UPI00136E4019|nr:ATP-binding protein [Streptomyces sp. SID3343]MYV97566.1 ATP-binding protein [Streptomyces sp. SID3343]
MNEPAPQLPATVSAFELRMLSTPLGARLARLRAAEELRAWQTPSPIRKQAELIIAELAANAVLHGRASDRDFKLTVTSDAALGTLRIAVTDTHGDRLPVPLSSPNPNGESGRGLLIVSTLAVHWGVDPHPPAGKTVWAELDVCGKLLVP